jgi:APA family basic amino acid/polyamine antiporter
MGQGAVAVGAICLLSAVNARGVQFGSSVIRGLAALKLGVLAFLVLWGIGLGPGDWSNFQPFVSQRPGSRPLLDALLGGMIAAFYSLGGWWDVSKVAGEVRDPQRTLPRALLLGVCLVTAVYLLVSMTFLYLVPPERIDSGEAFAALAGEALFGRSGGIALSLIVIITVLGSLAAVLMAMPRVYYAMARDGLFFHTVAKLHPRYNTPARAIGIQAVLAGLLAILGTFDQILSYFMVPTILFVMLTVGAVFVSDSAGSGRMKPLNVPWHPLPPLLFLVPTGVLILLMIMDRPLHAGVGLAVVLLGLPVYQLLFTRQQTREASASLHDPVEPPSAVVETS